MEFKEGITVYTADGKTVGDIERFVLDPTTRRIIGLVVRKGFLFTQDKVIPVEAVANTTEDRVTLNTTEGDDDFPPFEETHYVSPNDEELRDHYDQSFYAPLYYYPPATSLMWYEPTGVLPLPTVTERNIPDNSVPLSEGTSVVSRDGDHVGDVKRIFTDNKSRKVTHIAVSQGLLFKKEKVIPVMWIDTISEDKVQLAVGTKQLESLDVR